MSTVSKC